MSSVFVCFFSFDFSCFGTHSIQKEEKRCGLFEELGFRELLYVCADRNSGFDFLFSQVSFNLLVESMHLFQHLLSNVISFPFSIQFWPRHEWPEMRARSTFSSNETIMNIPMESYKLVERITNVCAIINRGKMLWMFFKGEIILNIFLLS